jgi:hypothetical protein
VSHLLAILVVQAATIVLAICRGHTGKGGLLGKVDFMVEEGGLRRRRGYYRHLYSVSIYYALFW